MRMMKRVIPIVLALLAISLTSFASPIDVYLFEDLEKEALYKKIVKELRCTVCQNQDIGASNAELAQDLRRKTYEMVADGKDQEYVLNFMAQRYGDFILYNPPLQKNTLVLWIGPLIILIIAIILLLRFIRRTDFDAPLSESDRVQAEKILERDE